MKLQILNIGNTHTQLAEWDGNAFTPLQLLRSAELSAETLRSDIPVVAASVVPAIRARLENAGVRFPKLTEFSGGIDFRLTNRNTLGADRVANAIALAAFHPLPGIVVDCGTAITLEIVDENRVFRGGAIAPGRALMRHALHQGTAQLPELAMSDALPQLPGNNTADAIRFGVDRGAAGLVRELVTEAARMFSQPPTILLTGGDATFFHAALPEAKIAPEEFTLHGIRIWYGA